MLILYHNRHIFSVDNNTFTYLDDYLNYLERPVNYWYLNASKRQRINLIRMRMWYLLKNSRPIFQQLLAREDCSSFKAPEQAIRKIYQWLQTLPHGIEPETGIDIDQWRQDLKLQFGHLLEECGQAERKRASTKKPHVHFHQILTGKDEASKERKFRQLVDILIKELWITETDTPGIYKFKNNNTGGRLQIAALYYTLDKHGHIEARLNAQQVARLFNSWLSHDISPNSFVKAFQTEQLDTFNCGPNRPRYKYVQDCKLLMQDL
jgi:hypothetical protein